MSPERVQSLRRYALGVIERVPPPEVDPDNRCWIGPDELLDLLELADIGLHTLGVRSC